MFIFATILEETKNLNKTSLINQMKKDLTKVKFDLRKKIIL